MIRLLFWGSISSISRGWAPNFNGFQKSFIWPNSGRTVDLNRTPPPFWRVPKGKKQTCKGVQVHTKYTYHISIHLHRVYGVNIHKLWKECAYIHTHACQDVIVYKDWYILFADLNVSIYILCDGTAVRFYINSKKHQKAKLISVRCPPFASLHNGPTS